MMDWVSAPGVSDLSAAILICLSFVTSAMTAALGIGGGIALLAVMAQLMPAPAIIPVHAVVQMASNLGRSALLIRAVDWLTLGPFAFGAIIGAAIGGSIAVTLPTAILQGALGLFILLTTWGPPPPSWARGRAGFAGYGIVSTILTMFVGATGPFIAAALKPLGLTPQTHVATFSAAMTFQHAIKIVVFGILGFGFGPYAPLMIAMIISGFAGTWIGTKRLKARSAAGFHRWLSWLLTALAARLIYVAVTG